MARASSAEPPQPASSGSSLLAKDDSILVVVDMQTGFFAAHDALDRDALASASARSAWLASVAAALGVPVVATEEDPARNGPTDARILDALPPRTPILEKSVFGLTGQPDIVAAVEASGRRIVVLMGCETDVCVSQSALGLLDLGYRVAVVTDATFSPGEMHAHGLRRMRDAGALELHAKGIYYEWVRTFAAARDFEAANPDLTNPPGFSL